MGDWFQVIVDRDATAEEAKGLGERIVAQLIERGIISSEMSDNVLGSESGYPPGVNYADATEGTDDHLMSLWSNGLDVEMKRTVFDSGQGGTEAVCAGCSARVEFDWEDGLEEAITEWEEGIGGGILACPVCGYEAAITEWQFNPPWGFGELGFTLWNWPPLKESFVEEIGEMLGHGVVLVAGKL